MDLSTYTDADLSFIVEHGTTSEARAAAEQERRDRALALLDASLHAARNWRFTGLPAPEPASADKDGAESQRGTVFPSYVLAVGTSMHEECEAYLRHPRMAIGSTVTKDGRTGRIIDHDGYGLEVVVEWSPGDRTIEPIPGLRGGGT